MPQRFKMLGSLPILKAIKAVIWQCHNATMAVITPGLSHEKDSLIINLSFLKFGKRGCEISSHSYPTYLKVYTHTYYIYTYLEPFDDLYF